MDFPYTDSMKNKNNLTAEQIDKMAQVYTDISKTYARIAREVKKAKKKA